MDDRSAMNLKSSDRMKQEVDNEQRFNFVQVSIDCKKHMIIYGPMSKGISC